MRALVPLAEGAEEMETVIIVDVLRRAGWEVALAGLHHLKVMASRGVRLEADTLWADVDPNTFDLIALPGGAGGMEQLKADERVLSTVQMFVSAQKWVAAVCASPVVLQAAGVLQGRRVTSHFSVKDQLSDATWIDEPVVVDEPIITSQGPGTSIDFALTIVGQIEGAGKGPRSRGTDASSVGCIESLEVLGFSSKLQIKVVTF